jgi:hypothetical protein
MARRSGKASRQSRQRRAHRSAARPAATPRPEAAAPDAFATADAAARAAGSQPTPLRTVQRSTGSRAADPRFQVAGPSRLSERAISDYHYVVRDLRNIGILVGVMAVLLVLATIAVRALGIGQV